MKANFFKIKTQKMWKIYYKQIEKLKKGEELEMHT